MTLAIIKEFGPWPASC